MTAFSDETGGEALESPQHIVEGIILRRLHDKRIEGYTLEMSKEIAAALSASPVGELTPEQISIQNDMFAAWVGDPKFREAFRNDCKRLLSVSLAAQEPVAIKLNPDIKY